LRRRRPHVNRRRDVGLAAVVDNGQCRPRRTLESAIARVLAHTAAVPDPEVEAELPAPLRYARSDRPGISRRRAGKGFIYLDPDGKRLRDRDTLARIRALVVPPAWTGVWISPDPRAHLQATGRDARGRKQYLYHPLWRALRDKTKYEHMLAFGRALPAIRRRVARDLAREGLPREKVLAAVVRLLEHTLARVGNSEYARANHSFGITTLRNRHVRIARGTVELEFRAKHGLHHHSMVSDRKLARILRQCRDLPGSELFQYLDEEGTRHSIDSDDVNRYLRAISGAEITAKDFRTWAGTSLALLALARRGAARPTKKAIVQTVKEVAAELGNTPAICRKCYIHPALFERYREGRLAPYAAEIAGSSRGDTVRAAEGALRRFLVAEAGTARRVRSPRRSA
jgi:DNA topoisomerase-1